MFKKIIVVLLIVTLALSLTVLPACKKTPQHSILARMEGATLVWDAYDGADSYMVKCMFTDRDGYSLKTTDLSYIAPYTTPGDYTFSVSALNADGEEIARSEIVAYHLGTGEAADVITIGSADDLMGITESVSISFGNKKVTTPVYYRLTADIDLTGKKFTPIGTSSKPFYSVFDGAGHTIKGLNFTTCNTDGNMGLFGYTKDAVIKNLNLEGSILFDKNSNTKKGELNCGLLVGHTVSTRVDNCHVKGDIDILNDTITSGVYVLSVGGVVGKGESGMISNVSYEGDIKAQYGRVNAGGIVGFGQGNMPGFMITNARSIANVSAVATSYNVEKPDQSYSQAFAGIIAGNLSTDVERVASALAIGTASARSTRDGTDAGNLTSGVFGRTRTNNSMSTLTMYNVYYVDTIERVAGNAGKPGAYASYVHPFSEAQLKDKENYNLGDGRYGLDFDYYWDIAENDFPELRKTPMQEQPSLTLTVASDIEGHTFSYDFIIEDVAPSTYLDISSGATSHMLCYDLDALLDKIGVGITSIYDQDEVSKGVSLKISAEGMEDRIVTTKKETLACYLQYGVYQNYEDKPDIFGGYKFVNATNSTKVETYDYTSVNHITITFLPAGGEEA